MARVSLGRSVEGRRIDAWVMGSRGAATTLILGGVHGDEPKSVELCRRLIDYLEAENGIRRRINACTRWVIVPVVNPDGYVRRKRRNAHRIDLNRNFPTRNWVRGKKHSRMFGGETPASEPETRAVIKLITRYQPAMIVTVHSISGHRFCNNYDGPARRQAKRMSKINGYPVSASIGYPTPGSFGTWTGRERGIPTITLELPSHHSGRRCWDDNREALMSVAAC